MTHDDFDDSDEAAEHDIRFYDLMEASFPSPPLPDQYARARRMMQMLRLRVLEWSGSRERVYFAQEFRNGLDE
jgi:hypothetical protein